MPSTPLQSYAMNIIFGCHLPLPEKFQYTGDILAEPSVKEMLKNLCTQVPTFIWRLYAIRFFVAIWYVRATSKRHFAHVWEITKQAIAFMFRRNSIKIGVPNYY